MRILIPIRRQKFEISKKYCTRNAINFRNFYLHPDVASLPIVMETSVAMIT